ncbi:MAG: OmpA family protein [Flavobacteriaceae bacterium]
MKYLSFFLAISLLVSFRLLGQSPSESEMTEVWGDYHFINKKYRKAVDAYEAYTAGLQLEQQRQLAQSYLLLGDKSAAVRAYTPVVNSSEARVEDYYRYADLLLDQKRLAAEYREKAYRLPWETLPLLAQDSLLFKVRFSSSPYQVVPVEGNTENNEFGLVFLNPTSPSDVLYLSDQKKRKQNARILKRIKTDLPIYNFFRGRLDTTTFELTQYAMDLSAVNTLFQEGPGSFDLTTNRFYFTRSKTRFDKNKTVQLGVYQLDKKDLSTNQLAEELPFNLPDTSSMHPSITPDGKRLYFASDRAGGFGGMDLYYVELGPTGFSKPINLGPDINTPQNEVFPYAVSATHFLYSSNGKDGLGQMDVFLAEHVIENRWEDFVLGHAINSTKDDFSFGLNPLLGLGYLASNREGGQGADDLYAFKFTPELSGQEDHYTYVPSDTLIVANRNVLVNDIKALNDKDPLQRLIEKEVYLSTEPKNGRIIFNKNGSFLYKNGQPLVSKDSFAYKIQTLRGRSEAVWVHLKRAEVNKEILTTELSEAFSSIYYGLDKSNLQNQYQARVDQVVAVMRKNPTLEIEVSSYTDCRGSARYNKTLSKKRTQTILDYVRERIDKPSRIYGDGYGELDGEETDEKDYQLIVGSYVLTYNIDKVLQKLKDMELNYVVNDLGKVKRIMIAQSDAYEELKTTQKQLSQLGMASWINENPCVSISEEEHQKHRRTDFKVIRL